jgi:hypothetical protein
MKSHFFVKQYLSFGYERNYPRKRWTAGTQISLQFEKPLTLGIASVLSILRNGAKFYSLEKMQKKPSRIPTIIYSICRNIMKITEKELNRTLKIGPAAFDD